MHAVRNAVSHGIEAPDDRARTGKSAVGRITLDARREGNTLVLAVRDDGRGLDEAAILAKARRLGLVGPEENPEVEPLRRLIFHPGFSTRPDANAIAGRGVGMDVVAREVAQLRGRTDLESRPGRGVCLTFRVPANLSLEPVMIVRVSDQAFAVPIDAIESLHRIATSDLGPEAHEGTVEIDGRRVRVVDMRTILGLSGRAPDSCPTFLMVRGTDGPTALRVDGVDGVRELIVKPLGPLLEGHPVLSGASLTTNGEVVFFLGPSALIRFSKTVGAPANPVALCNGATDREAALVVDDSLSVRRLASRNLRALGFDVDEAVDGEHALKMLRMRPYRLVLTDLEMPRMDGFELLAELKRTGVLDRAPVVVTSTRGDPATRRRVLELGASAFVAKPFSTDELRRVVPSLFARDAPAGPLQPEAPARPSASR